MIGAELVSCYAYPEDTVITITAQQAAKRAKPWLRTLPQAPKSGWPPGHLLALSKREQMVRLGNMRDEREAMAKVWVSRSKKGRRRYVRNEVSP